MSETTDLLGFSHTRISVKDRAWSKELCGWKCTRKAEDHLWLLNMSNLEVAGLQQLFKVVALVIGDPSAQSNILRTVSCSLVYPAPPPPSNLTSLLVPADEKTAPQHDAAITLFLPNRMRIKNTASYCCLPYLALMIKNYPCDKKKKIGSKKSIGIEKFK